MLFIFIFAIKLAIKFSDSSLSVFSFCNSFFFSLSCDSVFFWLLISESLGMLPASSSSTIGLFILFNSFSDEATCVVILLIFFSTSAILFFSIVNFSLDSSSSLS